MRKTTDVKGIVAAFAVFLVGLSPKAEAQQQNWFLTLEGLGSAIGISVRDADADETRRAGTTGVIVQSVRDGTPAARAGLREGDMVVEFDGERARSARQFTRVVRETAPGRPVKATVVRDGSRRTLDITPEARGPAELPSPPNVTAIGPGLRVLPRDFGFNFDFDQLPDTRLMPQRRLGVTVTPLTDQLAAHFGVKQGVLVSEVAVDTPAAAAGIKAGDVITGVNGHEVSTPDDVVREMSGAGAGSSVDVRVMRDRQEMTLTAKLPEQRRPVSGGGRPI